MVLACIERAARQCVKHSNAAYQTRTDKLAWMYQSSRLRADAGTGHSWGLQAVGQDDVIKKQVKCQKGQDSVW